MSLNIQLDNLFHIYNRGNNKQPIFFSDKNYLFFLEKVRKHIAAFCDILNYCLMPNHFHFVIYSSEKTMQTKLIGYQERNVLSEGFKNLLSSYAQSINKQNNSTGSLFQQNTKAKCLTGETGNYATTCFHYVHQNPWTAGMVNGTLCNKQLAFQLIDLDEKSFYEDSYKIADDDDIKNIF